MPEPMKTRAVIFDVDGVLLDSTRANIVFYQDLYRRAGLPVPTEAEIAAGSHLSVPSMLLKTHPTMAPDVIVEIMALADTIDAGYNHLVLPPMMPEVIALLAGQYALGIATNRSRSGVHELWRFTGLEKYFSAAAAYEDTVEHKPHPEPLFYNLTIMKVDPADAVFIGDALTDLAAAEAAGTKFIMFGATPVPAGTTVAKHFSELPALIDRLFAPAALS